MPRLNIAIDGPAGAGKSTIAKIIAKNLGIIYLDTGAMYRAAALKAIRLGLDIRDHEQIGRMAEEIEIAITYTNDIQHIWLDSEDVTGEIRTPDVSRGASDVAAVPRVRIRMVELQRRIAAENDVVMDGRDIGTYVLPDAGFKFFLTASVEERARRRFQELIEKGQQGITLEEVARDIASRDKNDSSRDFAPLAKASDAVEIDTTSLTIREAAEKIIQYIRKL